MVERRRSNQEIEVTDQHAGRTQAAPVFSEELARILIYTEERYRVQEVAQSPLTLLGIARVMHTLVEFGKRDDREREPLGLEISKPLRYCRLTVQEMDRPIGIHEVPWVHRRGSGRVRMRRSS